MTKLRTDFDTLKVTVFAKEYPGAVNVVYEDVYIPYEYVENATFHDISRLIAKAADDVLRKRLVE